MNKKTEDVIRNMDIGFMTHPEDYTEDERLDAFCKAITDYRDSLDPNDYEVNPGKLAVYKKACAFFNAQKGMRDEKIEPNQVPPFDLCASFAVKMDSFVIDDSNREEFLELWGHLSLFSIASDTDTIKTGSPFIVNMNIPDVYVEKEK